MTRWCSSSRHRTARGCSCCHEGGRDGPEPDVRESPLIHFDRWWNPAVEDQATDRAFRIGQRKNVQVRKLMCVGTLEERIDTLINRKKDLAERRRQRRASITELDTAQSARAGVAVNRRHGGGRVNARWDYGS